MSAPAALRRAAPRRGHWLFLAILLLFWGLLAVSGMDRFKRPEPTAIAYAIDASALAGVTGLRLEEAGGDNASRLSVGVVLDEVADMRITVQSRRVDGDDADTLPGKFPGLSASREGDTLVLRWTDVPASGVELPQRHVKSGMWMDEIVLPTQFRHLAIPRARIEARSPVERLEVVGRVIAVRGPIGHLDLWSTQCRPCDAGAAPALAEDVSQCAERTRRGMGSLEVNAARMRSLRVDARAGRLDLSETQGLERAALQLGNSVALSVDRAGVLEKARASAAVSGMPVVCGVAAAASTPVPLVSTGAVQAEGSASP